MSLITSCPACGTMFRVVPDQLKISEGWVRCGHCSEVFDATAHLSDESILAEPATAQAASPPVEAPGAPGMEEPPAAPVAMPLRTPEPPASAASAALPPDNSSFFGDSQALEPSPLDSPFVFRRSDLVLPDQDSSVLPPEPTEPMGGPDDDDDEAGEEPPPRLEHVSFVRQARRKAFWRRPLVRIGLAFVSLALAALLVVQLAYRDRDRLALAEPALRPVLARMCVLLRCTLGAPRQIEAIVIESSGFNRVRNDTYRLSFTLRNSAPVQVQAPAMELTITDAQDQPIARRVLTPAELGASGQAIPASSEWGRSLGIVLNLPGSARVAGYRLLALYP
jgi:predicted Zn finger-like uncharacterized protein